MFIKPSLSYSIFIIIIFFLANKVNYRNIEQFR